VGSGVFLLVQGERMEVPDCRSGSDGDRVIAAQQSCLADVPAAPPPCGEYVHGVLYRSSPVHLVYLPLPAVRPLRVEVWCPGDPHQGWSSVEGLPCMHISFALCIPRD